MIASDIDGTLLDYNYIPGEPPAINLALIRQIKKRTDRLVLVTNQGGLPFGAQGVVQKDERRYPMPEDFVGRLAHLGEACVREGLSITGLYVCVFHPKAKPESIVAAEEVLADILYTDPWCWLPVNLYSSEFMRKPSPAMLLSAGVACYYGDSDDDEQAALSAGIEFVRVERFFGDAKE